MLPSSPKGPCSAGKTASASSRPPPGASWTAAPAWPQRPSRVIVTSSGSCPAARRAGRTEAPEGPAAACSGERGRPYPPARTETSSGEAPPPLSTATFIRRSSAAGRSRAFFFFGERFFGPAADDQGHFRPGVELRPRRRELVDHPPDLPRHFGFFFFDERPEAGFAQLRHRFGALLADHVRDLGLLFARGNHDRNGRPPAELFAGVGGLRDHLARRA